MKSANFKETHTHEEADGEFYLSDFNYPSGIFYNEGIVPTSVDNANSSRSIFSENMEEILGFDLDTNDPCWEVPELDLAEIFSPGNFEEGESSLVTRQGQVEVEEDMMGLDVDDELQLSRLHRESQGSIASPKAQCSLLAEIFPESGDNASPEGNAFEPNVIYQPADVGSNIEEYSQVSRWCPIHHQMNDPPESAGKIRGAALHKGMWESRLGCARKNIYLGRYGTREEAGKAHDLAAIALELHIHPDFPVQLNEPDFELAYPEELRDMRDKVKYPKADDYICYMKRNTKGSVHVYRCRRCQARGFTRPFTH